MLRNSLTFIQILLSFGMVFSDLKCHGTSQSKFNMTINFCVYAHVYTDSQCSTSFHNRSEIHWDGNNVTDQCGHYGDDRETTILCFCNTNYCNTEKHIVEILIRLTKLKKLKSTSITAQSSPLSETAIEKFLCMKRELGLNAVRKGNEVVIVEEEKESSILVLVIAIIALLVVIAIATLLLIIFRRKSYKKWLAKSWNHRVEKAGEILDGQKTSTPKSVTGTMASTIVQA